MAVDNKKCLHDRTSRVWGKAKANPMGGVVIKWKCLSCQHQDQEFRKMPAYQTDQPKNRWAYQPRRIG